MRILSRDTSVLIIGFSFPNAKFAAAFCTGGKLKTAKSNTFKRIIPTTMYANTLIILFIIFNPIKWF
jgi:hypothetical protein